MAAVLATVALCALSGCGHPRPPDGSGGAVSERAVDVITESGRYPADRYLVDRAAARVAERCLRARGVRWSGFAGTPPAATDEEQMLRPAQRRHDGYGRPAKLPTLRPVRNANPLNRCLAAGQAAVAGDAGAWAELTYGPPDLAQRLPGHDTDPRFVAARRAWSACMARHHFPFATPAAARARAAAEPAEEIPIAVHDADCDHRTHLSLTDLALRREAARTLAPADRQQLDHLTATVDAATARARIILTGPA